MNMFVEEFDIFEIGVNILIAITECLSEETLRTQWRALRNKLAEERQMEAMDDFERWHPHLPHSLRRQSSQSARLHPMATTNKGCARYGT